MALMPPGAPHALGGLALPRLDGIAARFRAADDAAGPRALARALVTTGIGDPADWLVAGGDPLAFIDRTLERWVAQHGGAAVEQGFTLHVMLCDHAEGYALTGLGRYRYDTHHLRRLGAPRGEQARPVNAPEYMALTIDAEQVWDVYLGPALHVLAAVDARLATAFYARLMRVLWQVATAYDVECARAYASSVVEMHESDVLDYREHRRSELAAEREAAGDATPVTDADLDTDEELLEQIAAMRSAAPDPDEDAPPSVSAEALEAAPDDVTVRAILADLATADAAADAPRASARAWMEALIAAEALAAPVQDAPRERAFDEGNFGPSLPATILAFTPNDDVIACTEAEFEHVYEMTPRPSRTFALDARKPATVRRAFDALGACVRTLAALVALLRDLPGTMEEAHALATQTTQTTQTTLTKPTAA